MSITRVSKHQLRSRQIQMNPTEPNAINVKLVHIAAMSTERGIGIKNGLHWHIPADLKRFKALTGGGVMIMGRKTFESFGGRPLPNRHHIVVSRDPNFIADYEQVTVVRDIPQAIETGRAICVSLNQSVLWVIGGAQIYAQTIDQADRLELTLVNLTPECDAFYPDVPADFEFSSRESHTDPGSGVDYQFLSFVRKAG